MSAVITTDVPHQYHPYFTLVGEKQRESNIWYVFLSKPAPVTTICTLPSTSLDKRTLRNTLPCKIYEYKYLPTCTILLTNHSSKVVTSFHCHENLFTLGYQLILRKGVVGEILMFMIALYAIIHVICREVTIDPWRCSRSYLGIHNTISYLYGGLRCFIW